MTTLERAQLAAVFLSRWVDGAEGPTLGRLRKRLDNAFALADLVELESLAREHGDSVVACFYCTQPMLAGDAKAIGEELVHARCLEARMKALAKGRAA